MDTADRNSNERELAAPPKVVALVLSGPVTSASTPERTREQERLCAALSKCGYQVIVAASQLHGAVSVLKSLVHARIVSADTLVVCMTCDSRIVPLNHVTAIDVSRLSEHACTPALVRPGEDGDSRVWVSAEYENHCIVASACNKLIDYLHSAAGKPAASAAETGRGDTGHTTDDGRRQPQAKATCAPELCTSTLRAPQNVYAVVRAAAHEAPASMPMCVQLRGSRTRPAFAFCEDAEAAAHLWTVFYDDDDPHGPESKRYLSGGRDRVTFAREPGASAKDSLRRRQTPPRPPSHSSSSSSDSGTSDGDSDRGEDGERGRAGNTGAIDLQLQRQRNNERQTERADASGSSRRYPKLPTNPEALLAMTRQAMILEPESELCARCQEALAKSNPQGLERLKILVSAWRSKSSSYAKEVRQMLVQAATERTLPAVHAQIKASDEYIRKLKARRKRVSVRDSMEKRIRAHEQAHDVGMRGRWSETRTHPQHAFKR